MTSTSLVAGGVKNAKLVEIVFSTSTVMRWILMAKGTINTCFIHK